MTDFTITPESPAPSSEWRDQYGPRAALESLLDSYLDAGPVPRAVLLRRGGEQGYSPAEVRNLLDGRAARGLVRHWLRNDKSRTVMVEREPDTTGGEVF